MGIILFLGIALFVVIAFLSGRNYERKQFVKIGTRKSDIQKILGVFNDHGTKN